jgi:ATP-dependent protease ClpP protease subunit
MIRLQANPSVTTITQPMASRALRFAAAEEKKPSYDVSISGRLTAEKAIELRTTLNKMADEIIDKAKKKPDTLEKPPIRIRLCSQGGELLAGDILTTAIKAIQDKGVTVDTYVDKAYSAAANIAIVGTHRYISPYGRLLLHQPSFSFDKDEKCNTDDLDDLANSLKKDTTRSMAFIIHHANELLTTDLLKRKIKLGQDWMLNAKKAIYYGLVDSVKAIDF